MKSFKDMTERTIKDYTCEELKDMQKALKNLIKPLPKGCRVRNHYELRLQAIVEEIGVMAEENL